MDKRIEQIRQLLDELDGEDAEAQVGSSRDFAALELPLIIQEIVDDLQPLLTPYDAAFYWYLFRHSISNNGKPHLRVSSRKLQKAVVKSSYSYAKENTISQGKVQETLRALGGLACGQAEGDRLAQTVGEQMDFGAQTTSGTPQRLVFGAPFLRPVAGNCRTWAMVASSAAVLCFSSASRAVMPSASWRVAP
jgi:hypothetical protein